MIDLPHVLRAVSMVVVLMITAVDVGRVFVDEGVGG